MNAPWPTRSGRITMTLMRTFRTGPLLKCPIVSHTIRIGRQLNAAVTTVKKSVRPPRNLSRLVRSFLTLKRLPVMTSDPRLTTTVVLMKVGTTGTKTLENIPRIEKNPFPPLVLVFPILEVSTLPMFARVTNLLQIPPMALALKTTTSRLSPHSMFPMLLTPLSLVPPHPSALPSIRCRWAM